jgi:hypothetical protein
MKLSDYLMFAALLTPTLVVAAAAVLTLVAPAPEPEYQAPVYIAWSNGLYPADLREEVDR